MVAIGLPCAFVGTNIAAVTAVEQAETGLASGLMNAMQRVGSGSGIAVLTAAFVARTGPLTRHTSLLQLTAGFQMAFLGAALFAVLGAILTVLLIRLPEQAQGPAQSEERTSLDRNAEDALRRFLSNRLSALAPAIALEADRAV